jgi:putative Mn2+ efflux pump MntP
MSLPEIIAIAVGLSMDALAVSVVIGSSPYNVGFRPTFRVAFHFGLFQFLMPVMGWYAGIKVAGYVQAFDHWIAFLLLAWIGGKMIFDSVKGEDKSWSKDPTRKGQLFFLSVATSIDALATGFSLSMLRVDIWQPSVLIGVITALLSWGGMCFGCYLGKRFGQWMTTIGGCVLCLIGLKILLEHLLSG